MRKLIDKKIFGEPVRNICLRIIEGTAVTAIFLIAHYLAHKLGVPLR